MAVFAALIVLSLCGLGWYLVAGHSWNVAASNIDDTFGSMDGYTAIVYAGTADPLADDDTDADAAVGAASGKKAPSAGAVPADSSNGADPVGSGGDGSESKPPAAKTEPGKNAGSGAASSSGASSSAGKLVGGTSSSTKAPLTVTEAQGSYEDKKATVFSLDTVNLARYSEGTILKKGDHRFGVFSVAGPMTKRALEKQVEYFAEHKVDFIVVITPDKEYVEGASGIDIVVSTKDEDLFVMGETLDGTFYVDAPEVGKVGVILISPSNVVSAKVLEEL